MEKKKEKKRKEKKNFGIDDQNNVGNKNHVK